MSAWAKPGVKCVCTCAGNNPGRRWRRGEAPVKGRVYTVREANPMTDWQDIETAPKDGTAFQARIPGNGDDNVIAWGDGLLDSDGKDCGGWYFVEDQEAPGNWTDGVCWTVNADGEPSTLPTHWKPLPTPEQTP